MMKGNFLLKFLRIICARPKKIIQIVNNLIIDLRFGGCYLGVSLNNTNETLGYINTGSTEYSVFTKIFQNITLIKADVIVDVGCGKGRLLNWCLNKQLKNKSIGIEVYPDLAYFT